MCLVCCWWSCEHSCSSSLHPQGESLTLYVWVWGVWAAAALLSYVCFQDLNHSRSVHMKVHFQIQVTFICVCGCVKKERSCMLTYVLHKFTRGGDYESVGVRSELQVMQTLWTLLCCRGKGWCPAEVLIALCTEMSSQVQVMIKWLVPDDSPLQKPPRAVPSGKCYVKPFWLICRLFCGLVEGYLRTFINMSHKDGLIWSLKW